ncbi:MULTISPECIES: hypothetical protein [unclassified Streptomyces]|uniref:hypothetical protein n=1 Tax=unclassified Streptomyces TaxID=2593676 RepID=UPI00037EE00E|nr:MULTISPECIES: hypothetical protein [unclassified Streptomyces]MYT28230.1 hypothetical protein [Streptomyces sp. SID8354]
MAVAEDLLIEVPAHQRPSVRQLIGTLLERDLARDTGSDPPHTLDDEEAERYAAQVQFIDCFTDSAERRFQVQGLAVTDAVWIWPVRTPATDAPDGDGGGW